MRSSPLSSVVKRPTAGQAERGQPHHAKPGLGHREFQFDEHEFALAGQVIAIAAALAKPPGVRICQPWPLFSHIAIDLRSVANQIAMGTV